MRDWGMKIHILTLFRYADRVTKNCTGIYPGERGGQVLNNSYYRLAYEFHKKWSPFPVTVEDWQQAGKEAAQTCAENGNDKFLIDVMVAVYSDLEQEYKKAERGENTA